LFFIEFEKKRMMFRVRGDRRPSLERGAARTPPRSGLAPWQPEPKARPEEEPVP